MIFKSLLVFFIYGYTMINSFSLPYRQVLMMGKNYCQITAIDIQKKHGKMYPLIGDDPICYFDFITGNEGHNFYINSSPGYFSEVPILQSPFSDDIGPRGKKSEFNISANLETNPADPNYYYSFDVDFIDEKMYGVTTKSSIEPDKLFVVDLKTRDYAIILSNLESPNHLCLDPLRGLLFISQSTSIIRVNRDGSLVKKIINETGTSNLAVDYKNKRIYWTNLNVIQSSNYAGKNRFTIIEDLNPILSLTALNNQIFWVTSPNNLVPDTIVWICDVTKPSDCFKQEFASTDTKLGQERILLKAYDLDEIESITKYEKNSCKERQHRNEPTCDHLCFPSFSTSKNFSCACVHGYGFNGNSEHCQLVNDYLLYIENNFVKGKRLESNDTEAFADVLEPNVLMTKAAVTSFDYDYTDKIVHFIDSIPNNNTLNSKEVLPNKHQYELNKYDFYNIYNGFYEKVTSISYDWVSKNVYVLYELVRKDGGETDNTGSGSTLLRGGIHVQRFSKKDKSQSYKNRLLSFKFYYSAYYSIRRPTSVVVHPNLGKIYFVCGLALYSANTDGTNFLRNFELDTFVGGLTRGLTIDFTDDNLYWISNSNNENELQRISLRRNKLNSTDIEKLFKIPVKNPISLSFNSHLAFVSNVTSIWRMNKRTGDNISMMVGSIEFPKVISGARIFSRESQPLFKGNPCAVNNGDCQKFCYAKMINDQTLKRQCGCEDTEMLLADEKRCSKTYSMNSKVPEYS